MIYTIDYIYIHFLIITFVDGISIENLMSFDEMRHDLYITLDNAEFSQGKNIELVIEARQEDGERIKVCLHPNTALFFIYQLPSIYFYYYDTTLSCYRIVYLWDQANR